MLTIVALSISILIGAVGLGTEAASWYATKRAMQVAADLAAESAVVAMQAGANKTTLTSEAKATTALQHYPDGVNNIAVTVNNPPLSGSNSGKTNAVEVIIAQPAPLLFSSLFLSSSPTIMARA
ncbi:MAG: hypothetical protein QOK29_1498, partial [Rhodospirillaceae bacterium]|nr:hypothetical protein [Rhodospirillaceae bacterium]